jgi:3-hexulose-6-phosphate synthase
MKLQLALDDLSLKEALILAQQVQDAVDIFEIGTPFILRSGMEVVRIFKERFPNHEILADTKIMDAGYYEAQIAFKAGADDCTVCGITDQQTIKECLRAAKNYHKKLYVDTICMPDLTHQVPQLEALGVDHISVHVGVDQQALGQTPIVALKTVKAASQHAVISVAGGIKLNTVAAYQKADADVIIVGGGILHATDPVETALALGHAVHQDA